MSEPPPPPSRESTIEKLTEIFKTVKLTEILDDEKILNRINQTSTEWYEVFLKHITTKEKINELILLVLTENNFKKEDQWKYPHLATQLLCSSFSSHEILPLILKNHLDVFFMFLNGKSNEMKPLDAHNICNLGFLRILFEIIKSDEDMVLQDYFYSNNGLILINMMEFIYYPEIEDFYANIFNFGDLEDELVSKVNEKLMDKLINMMLTRQCDHAVNLLDLALDNDYYYDYILNEKKFSGIFNDFLNCNDNSGFQSTLKFFKIIFSDYESSDAAYFIMKNFDKLVDYLKKGSGGSLLVHANNLEGELMENPLNQKRLSLVCWMFDMTGLYMDSDNFDILQILFETNTFETLIELFFEYHHNNIYHALFIEFFMAIWNPSSMQLVNQIFDGPLIPMIFKTWKNNNYCEIQHHLQQLINIINSFSFYPEISNRIKCLDEKWIEITNDTKQQELIKKCS
eukprot:gene3584-6319_t